MRTHLTLGLALLVALLSPSLSFAQESEVEDNASEAQTIKTETKEDASKIDGDPSTQPEAEVTETQANASTLPYEKGIGLSIGAKLGGGFGQLTSPLGSSLTTELELGYVLPFADRTLQFFVAGAYAAPSTEETLPSSDPRLPGMWSYKLTLEQLNITPGLLFRFPLESQYIRPYLAAGMKIGLTKTEVSGESAGERFGSTEETATDYGGFGSLGVDIFMGPGALLLEAQFGYTAVDGYILQNTNSGALNLALGYRLFL